MLNGKKRNTFLSISLPPLDVLRLPYGSLTEIVAPSGCGKTQLCIAICIAAITSQITGHKLVEKRVIYIDTEGSFSAERWHTLNV